MVFSSTLFIFLFLPLTLAGYYLFRVEFRNYWLLFMSLIFFGWSQPKYLIIIILNIFINYCGAIIIGNFNLLKKITLVGVVVANLAILFYYKYFDFAIETVNSCFNSSFALKNIVLPIGISFFTFQGLSYVVDVYRGDAGAQRNPFKVALYITLFPQLIAGPIVRYKDVANEIDNRKFSVDDFSGGVSRFIIGLGKKVLVANTMASLVDSVWNSGANANGVAVAWVASIAYTLQIYFDFSGYSDMAIGLGRMFGFHFSENFNLPYISQSITEFWRRWHISLSSWFRDYVYIPLGGNRKRVYLNLAIVFVLTGIWHGASWHFLVWGIWNGIFIILERFIKARQATNTKAKIEKSKPNSIIKKLYTLFIINIGWILFRAPETDLAFKFIMSMFGNVDYSKVGYALSWYLDKWTVLMMFLGILFASELPSRMAGCIKSRISSTCYTFIKYIALLMLFYICIMRIVSGTYNPFIYYQF